MRVTFLGTGSAMPTGERSQTGLLVETDDHRVLTDCGSGVLHRLAATRAGYEGVDTVLLTHHHLDHVSDLMPLMKAKWLAGTETLHVYGPPDTEQLLEGLLGVHDYMQDRLDLSVTEVTPGAFSTGGLEVEAFETTHSMYCHAYRFRTGDADVTFSGDTEAMSSLIDFASDTDVLIHDCSFPDGVDVSNHPTPSQLGRVLSGASIDTVYLTHLYPHTDGQHAAMLESIADHYDGDVAFAQDGLTIEV